jgi:hypothetical protein
MRPAIDHACRGALDLRDWALGLNTDDADGSDSPPPPAVDAAAWQLFLAREGCASMLPAGPAVVGDLALEEVRRSLAARAQLRRIAQLLMAAGIEAVVLKGAVDAASGGTLELADVDLLVAPKHVREVATLLERHEGVTPVGADARVGGRGMTHLAPRVAVGSLPVEVHFALHHFSDVQEALGRAVPLKGLPGLSRLAAPDHLLHLVVHSALQHPERRGRLRDLLLVRDATRACTPAELADVATRLGYGAATAPCRALLVMATELAVGGPVHDRFRDAAATRYLLAARGGRGHPTFARLVSSASIALTDGNGDYLRLLRSCADPGELASTFKWVATLEQRWPELGRSTRIAGGIARVLLATGPALAIAWKARRLAVTS